MFMVFAAVVCFSKAAVVCLPSMPNAHDAAVEVKKLRLEGVVTCWIAGRSEICCNFSQVRT
jgi:hypothetical protein